MRQKVRVGILFGGQSAEHEISILSARNVLADGSSAGFDAVNFLDVELADGDHWLESRDDAALGNGANLAVVGSEVFQFGRATATGPGRFRLEHLLRGRFGSEWAAASHARANVPSEPLSW